MNITLSVDEDVVARARAVAEARGTSLNQLIREHLAEIAGMDTGGALAEALERSWAAGRGSSGGRKIHREDAYEGRLK